MYHLEGAHFLWSRWRDEDCETMRHQIIEWRALDVVIIVSPLSQCK